MDQLKAYVKFIYILGDMAFPETAQGQTNKISEQEIVYVWITSKCQHKLVIMGQRVLKWCN